MKNTLYNINLKVFTLNDQFHWKFYPKNDKSPLYSKIHYFDFWLQAKFNVFISKFDLWNSFEFFYKFIKMDCKHDFQSADPLLNTSFRYLYGICSWHMVTVFLIFCSIFYPSHSLTQMWSCFPRSKTKENRYMPRLPMQPISYSVWSWWYMAGGASSPKNASRLNQTHHHAVVWKGDVHFFC